MKSIAAITLFILFFQSSYSQTDYSGSYSYSYKVKFDPRGVHPPKDEADAGASGYLTVLSIDKTHYKFWLDINKGWPGYHMGVIDGIMTATNNKGIYTIKKEYADSGCVLKFTFSATSVNIQQEGADSDCGFGANVYADGNYKKRNAHKITPREFSKQYMDAFSYTITADKAYIFEDTAGIKKKSQYFIKDDEVLSTNESGNFIYIEHLTQAGKFIYGWIRKDEVEYNKR